MPRTTDTHLRYDIPSCVTVQVDTREKYPVLFPGTIKVPHPEILAKKCLIKVNTERVALPFGDYRLKEYPNECVIERKASQLELWKNHIDSHDRVRQAKSFRKLSGCNYPYILIEASPTQLMTPAKVGNVYVSDPELLAHKIGTTISKYGLHVLWMPWKRMGNVSRRKVGELLVHLMVAHGIHKKLDFIPELV